MDVFWCRHIRIGIQITRTDYNRLKLSELHMFIKFDLISVYIYILKQTIYVWQTLYRNFMYYKAIYNTNMRIIYGFKCLGYGNEHLYVIT